MKKREGSNVQTTHTPSVDRSLVVFSYYNTYRIRLRDDTIGVVNLSLMIIIIIKMVDSHCFDHTVY